MNRFIHIGDRLKELRMRSSLQKKEFAQLVDIPYRTYHDYEAGKTMPKEDALQRISGICNVSIDWILGIEDNEKARKSEHLKQIPYKKELRL